MMAHDPRQSAQSRWLGAAALLQVVRSEPGITRTAAAQRLGIGSGNATELAGRLRDARLLDEKPAPAQGRGRPTTLLGPHTEGPLVLAVDLRAGDWRLALAGWWSRFRISLSVGVATLTGSQTRQAR